MQYQLAPVWLGPKVLCIQLIISMFKLASLQFPCDGVEPRKLMRRRFNPAPDHGLFCRRVIATGASFYRRVFLPSGQCDE